MIGTPKGDSLSDTSTAQPLRSYSEASLEMTPQEFGENYQYPFLLYSMISSGEMTPVQRTKTPTVDRLVVGETPRGVRPVTAEECYLVYALASKVQDLERVSLGCSSSCDVVFNDVSISRLHAWLLTAKHGYYLEDADSSAGTAINGVTLVTGMPVKVKTGDRVSLGNVDLIFLPSLEFYTFVRRISGG